MVTVFKISLLTIGLTAYSLVLSHLLLGHISFSDPQFDNQLQQRFIITNELENGENEPWTKRYEQLVDRNIQRHFSIDRMMIRQDLRICGSWESSSSNRIKNDQVNREYRSSCDNSFGCPVTWCTSVKSRITFVTTGKLGQTSVRTRCMVVLSARRMDGESTTHTQAIDA